MTTYDLQVVDRTDYYLGILYKVKTIRITAVDGKFYVGSLPLIVRIYDISNELRPIKVSISGNEKVVNAVFTVDAFGIFPGNVNVEFGYENNILHTFTNVNLSSITTSDPSNDLPAPVADNNWLNNL